MGRKVKLSPWETSIMLAREHLSEPISPQELRRSHIAILTARLALKEYGYPVYPVTSSDLPDDPCERCGYFFLNTDWIFRLWGKEDPMRPACALHDSLYDNSLNGGIPRKTADKVFYEAMLAIVREGKATKFQARLYYRIVRLTGWLVW